MLDRTSRRWCISDAGKEKWCCYKTESQILQLMSWNCLYHRLELSVNDAVKSCIEINQIHCVLYTARLQKCKESWRSVQER